MRSINSQKLAALVLVGCLLLFPASVFAFETDQYDLPPVPLADIGDEVAEHVEQKLHKAVDKTNAEILRRQRCISGYADGGPGRGCDSLSAEVAKLSWVRCGKKP